jgi:hypothetical protein
VLANGRAVGILLPRRYIMTRYVRPGVFLPEKGHQILFFLTARPPENGPSRRDSC